MKDNNLLLDVAYFSMEIALENKMPTYSGGLGVLAGDTLRTFADFNIAAMGITLMAEQGYVDQEFDTEGKQISLPEKWDKEKFLTKLPFTLEVPFNHHKITCAIWRYIINSKQRRKVPVYFLDTNLPVNTPYDRTLTQRLYGGDKFYRLCQEQILGHGGFLLLNKLGLTPTNVHTYHLNEGHAAFASVSLYDWALENNYPDKESLEFVRRKVVFTTHTPVPAGHDIFRGSALRKVIPEKLIKLFPEVAFNKKGQLNMSKLALFFSGKAMSVARRQEEISEKMFPDYDIIPITNGVYHLKWVHSVFKEIYDSYIPFWEEDPGSLHKILSVSDHKIWQAHLKTKKKLIDYVNKTTKRDFAVDVFTLGFARRVASYKRPTLILSDIKKLERIARKVGHIQIVFAGEAHPNDKKAARLIAQIFKKSKQLNETVKVVFLEDYDMELALMLVAGVDVWLNTPLRPFEASGTSGMKAALNGVPQLSVLDGWWVEGWVEGVTGWAIGSGALTETKPGEIKTLNDLYTKLEKTILPLYYGDREKFIGMMKHAIALNGSRFNTYRMVQEYIAKIYSFRRC